MEVRMLVDVNGREDVGVARRALKKAACGIGFDEKAIGEMEVAVSELATNLVVHQAVSGEIILTEINDRLGAGLEIVARDRGPGIADVKAALHNHTSGKGGMGCGLGAVKRLMDEFDIHSIVPDRSGRAEYGQRFKDCGTVVTARKWLRESGDNTRFQYSAHSRPYPGESANGDAFFIKERRDGLFIAVADGIGHGLSAAEASEKAMAFIRDCGPMAFDRLLIELNDQLRKTRGVALTLVNIHPDTGTLTHAGIGNVEARLYPRGKFYLLPRAGIIGAGRPPRPKVTRIPWPSDATLIIYTDGISGRWDLNEEPELLCRSVTALGHVLFQKYARSNDDATIVVAREGA